MTAPWIDLDVGAWIGGYPFRDVPHPEPEVLVSVLDREGIGRALVGWLPAAWHRDPAPANDALERAIAPHATRLLAAPVVRPDWPRWEREFARQQGAGARAIRAYPAQWGLGPGHPALTELAGACAEAGLPLVIQIRFEDLRQRHYMDTAGDVPAATVRTLARAGTGCALLVCGSGRELVEEVHWGLTPEERSRVWYDFGWLWGPPEEHVAHLFRTIGAERFVVASHWPLRLVQQSRALWSLLPPAHDDATLAQGRAFGVPK